MAHVDGWSLPQEIPLAVRALADREAPMAWSIEGGADSSDERARQGKVLETSIGCERVNVRLHSSLGSPSFENLPDHCN